MAQASDQDALYREMVKEIQGVCDWFSLGLYLDVPLTELRKIECQYNNHLNRCKIELLDTWFQLDNNPCWESLGKALSKLTGHESHGQRVLATHCDHKVEQATAIQRLPMLSSRPAFPKHVRPLVSRSSDGIRLVPISHDSPQFNPHHAVHPYSSNPRIHTSMASHAAISQRDVISNPRGLGARFADVNHHLSLGERIVDTQTENSGSLQQGINLLSSATSTVSRVFNTFGQRLPICNTDPMSFLPYNPVPNPTQSPFQQLQVVPQQPSSQEWIAKKELERLYFDFQDLLIQTKELLTENKVAGKSVKEYLEDMVCGSGNPNAMQYTTLKSKLSQLPSGPSIKDVFGVLLEHLHYDNSHNTHLLQYLVKKFIPTTNASKSVTKYQEDFRNFETWCPLGVLANAHQKLFPPSQHHFSDTSVSVHLNDDWQYRPFNQLNHFQSRELLSYTSENSFHMVHLEKRSIFVVWETSAVVISELCESIQERFRSLGSQGVLQLFIGTIQVDFTDSKGPRFYRLELQSSYKPEYIGKSPSLISLQSDLSHGTYDSSRTMKSHGIDSGCYSFDTISSASTVKDAPIPTTRLPTYSLSDRVLEKYPFFKVQFDYQGEEKSDLSVKKGDNLCVLSDHRDKKYVMNDKKQYGYIPSHMLPHHLTELFISSPDISRHSTTSCDSETASTDNSESVSDITAETILPVDVIRHRVYTPNELMQSDHPTTLMDTPSDIPQMPHPLDTPKPIDMPNPLDIPRPDTPPGIAHIEALKIELSENRNNFMPEDLEFSYPAPKLERKRLKLNLMRSIDTKSLTKSLHHDLKKLDIDEEISPTLYQRVKKFFQRPRADSISIVSVKKPLTPTTYTKELPCEPNSSLWTV